MTHQFMSNRFTECRRRRCAETVAKIGRIYNRLDMTRKRPVAAQRNSTAVRLANVFGCRRRKEIQEVLLFGYICPESELHDALGSNDFCQTRLQSASLRKRRSVSLNPNEESSRLIALLVQFGIDVEIA